MSEPAAQRSPEWFKARLGRVTGSSLKSAMGKNWKKFIERISLEELLQIIRHFDNEAMAWGRYWEPVGTSTYEIITGRKVVETGLVISPFSDLMGSSVDGLVDSDGTLEIKAPFRKHNHDAFLFTREVPSQYIWQTRAHIIATGRDWCDFASFYPEHPQKDLEIVRVNACEKVENAVRARIKECEEYKAEYLEKLIVF